MPAGMALAAPTHAKRNLLGHMRVQKDTFLTVSDRCLAELLRCRRGLKQLLLSHNTHLLSRKDLFSDLSCSG